jgi:hypothetical protein
MRRGAFEECRGLQFIDPPPNLVKLGEKAFVRSRLGVVPLELMPQLSRIGFCSCEANRNLRSLLIPGSVVEIRQGAFADCDSLSRVEFVVPSKLASISWQSFRRCKSLSEFRIVASVREICGNFLELSGVHHISVDADNSEFETIGGFLVNRDRTAIIRYFGEDCDLRIDVNIETIGDYAFSRCRCLRSVTFEPGSKLKRIGNYAFASCMSLKLVQFGGPCPKFDTQCFSYCLFLEKVVFASRSDRVPRTDDAFHGCSSLKLE